MDISNFLNISKYDDSKVQEVLKNINLKQFIPSDAEIGIWQITYAYTTARGNDKQGKKYIFDFPDAWDRIEQTFYNYIEEYNYKYQYKKLSNVKILDVDYIGELVIPIEY